MILSIIAEVLQSKFIYLTPHRTYLIWCFVVWEVIECLWSYSGVAAYSGLVYTYVQSSFVYLPNLNFVDREEHSTYTVAVVVAYPEMVGWIIENLYSSRAKANNKDVNIRICSFVTYVQWRVWHLVRTMSYGMGCLTQSV